MRWVPLVSVLIVVLMLGGIVSQVVTASGKFPAIIGMMSVPPSINICSDYGSKRNNTGGRYRVRLESGTVLTQHEGIDFCAGTGTPVVSASYGEVWKIRTDKKSGDGHRVWVRTEIRSKRFPDDSANPLVYLFYNHIVVDAGLRLGKQLAPGDLIGTVHRAGPSKIGPRSHLHFQASTGESLRGHIDPHRFWLDGPGVVTCLDPSNPPPIDKITSPLEC